MQIKEAGATTRTGPGRIKITLITPGQGSSGYYAPDVIEQAAKDTVFPRGTQMHINHDTEWEAAERPAGDLRNLAAVITEDAYVEDGKLVAEALVGSAWRAFVEEFHEFIGTSINASADIKNSPDGRVIERLLPSQFNRVDFVTVAGRGGKVEQIIEAAKVIESRSMVSETLNGDIGEYLRQAVRHSDIDSWAYLEDFDSDNAFYETGGRIYQRAYTLDGVNVTWTSDPIEVRRQVTYIPVTSTTPATETDSPSGPVGATETKEAATMATTQIEEAELTKLRESASRAEALEAENRDLREAKQREDRAAHVTALVGEAFGDIAAPRTRAAVVAEAIAGEYDDEKTTAAATEAAAEFAVENGAGQVHGIGGSTATEAKPVPTDEDIINALEGGK